MAVKYRWISSSLLYIQIYLEGVDIEFFSLFENNEVRNIKNYPPKCLIMFADSIDVTLTTLEIHIYVCVEEILPSGAILNIC